MNKLNLKFDKTNRALPLLTIDDKKTKSHRIENGARLISHQTEKDVVYVSIYKNHNYAGKFWFVWNLFCYLISFFGWFDVRENKECFVIDFLLKINLKQETEVSISLLEIEKNEKFAEIANNVDVEVLKNVQYIDKQALKRKKIMGRIKALVFIAAVAVVAILLFV